MTVMHPAQRCVGALGTYAVSGRCRRMTRSLVDGHPLCRDHAYQARLPHRERLWARAAAR